MLERLSCALAAALALTALPSLPAEAADGQVNVAKVVSEVVEPLMKTHGIPGMAVGVVTPEGRKILTFGVASKATGAPVTPDTLFEIGSISKTFTATLATYAQTQGKLRLADKVSDHMPELAGTAFDRVSLLNLATHTTGGMPLQFPDTVTNEATLMDYYRDWSPSQTPGSSRTYANPGIGLLGVVAAKAMGADFTDLMERRLYPALGLRSTYLDVPQDKQARYAQGYTKADRPVRVSPGVLDKEAYGVRTTVGDLTHFMSANMGPVGLNPEFAEAIANTHVGYYRLGSMTQDLIWEQYPYPVALADLLAGNGPDVAYKPNPVKAISPPAASRGDVWINKTGSTSGFGAYIAFVPERSLGIVLLANKYYPNEARVAAAYEILTKLNKETRAAD